MKILVFLISFLSISCFVYTQTAVSGGIYQNATWTLTGNPYIVTGSIVVFPGNTLTIEPGVEILINNQTNNEIYIETRGTINCIGTDLLPIKIRTMYDTLNNVGWKGFVCTSSQGGVLNADRFQISNAHFPFAYETPLNNYQYTNCKFSHCFQAITVANTVNLANCQLIDNEVAVYGWSYFTIDNCFFKDNTTSIYAYSSALQLTNSSFIDNQIGLSFASNVYDSIYISNCQFLNNGLAINYPNNGKIQNCTFNDNATAIQAAYKCEILNNAFSYNEIGIEASVNANIHDNQINNNFTGLIISNVSTVQDSPLIYNNEICGNINYNVNNNTNMNYSLLNNCFCGLDSTAIELYLFDGYDDITKGLINYSLFNTDCSSVLGTVLKFQGQGVGISEMMAQSISYSNPVTDFLRFFQETSIDKLIITNSYGQTFTVNAQSPNVFDLRFLNAGIYFIEGIQENKKTQTFKLIKQ